MKKKLLIMTIVLMTIVNTIIPVANAATIITKAGLIYDHAIDSHILYYNESKEEWRDIQCGYICYKIDGQKYPAYCVTHGVNGVDEEGPYTVTIKELLNNKVVYNTILNGYPYKTAAQLGVETNDDAYVATKHAVNCVLLGRDVKSFYKAADERGEKIINAIYNISEKGKVGNEINKDTEITIKKVGQLRESGKYYYQEYNIEADENISNYTVNNLKGFSKECYITDSNANKKNEFSGNQNFRIMIPKADLNKDISGTMDITATCNTQPIFYGKAPNSNMQDYAVTYKPYVEYDKKFSFNEKTNTASIKVIKRDEKTLKVIEGVKFSLYKENGDLIETLETDSNGTVIFKNLYQGTYKLKEVESNENYIRDEETYQINAEYGKQILKTFTNAHKKGNLKIKKVDKDNNDIVLEGIEFELIDLYDNVVVSLVTDKNGEAEAKNINTGKYTLKETKTKEEYNLCIDSDIEVKWDTTVEIKIENEKKKGQVKIIKQDKENSDIKLENVEFEIMDENNRIVEKVKTNSKGEALSCRLPIGEYTVKEISLGENVRYILNENEYKVKIENNKITETVIENEYKKGNLKIKKVDKDNNDITLGAIEFDLINEKGEVIKHLTTDVNGEAEIKDINIGTYTLRETKTKREYNLCENKNIIVEWNKTSNVIVENEKKKGQIKVIKEDADISDIKLEGVIFQILDKNNKVLEKIKTNENGEAISSRLPIGEYKLKELSLGNNDNYLLNNEEYTIQIEDNKIIEIKIKNEHKKGNIIIKKIDKDDNNVMLEGVEFEVTDKDGLKYKGKTNKAGIVQIKDIRIGKIKIKETLTNKEYVLLNENIESEIKYNKTTEIVVENEKRKGQIEIYKTDKDDSNIKISDVEFQILDTKNRIIDTLKTNKNGYAISKRLPIGNYYLKEVKTNKKYILNSEVLQINIEENKVLRLNIKNEKAKGKIQIIKSSNNDSPIFDIKQGEYISGVIFEIFNNAGELVDTITTDENGKCISKDLVVGRYKIREKSTNKYYILNTNEYFININTNGEIKLLNIENEPIIPIVNIEKTGQQFAEKNEEIKYEFNIQNMSNSKLDNFTWKEYIPYEKSSITKMITGIYNEELEYQIYYKTNLNDYKLLKTANSLESEYLTFENLNLSNKEKITEIKAEYGTVSNDFKCIVKPAIFTKIESNVKNGDNILNITEICGNVEEYMVKDKSSFETIIKETKILKKLPKTGC